MPRKRGKKLVVNVKEREELERIKRARAEKKARVERAMYILNIACKKPKEKGLPQEKWSMNLLAKYIRENCEISGFPELNKIAKGTVFKIFSKSNIKPHKISYYLDRTDDEFEEKMYKVLNVYKDLEIWRKEGKKI